MKGRRLAAFGRSLHALRRQVASQRSVVSPGAAANMVGACSQPRARCGGPNDAASLFACTAAPRRPACANAAGLAAGTPAAAPASGSRGAAAMCTPAGNWPAHDEAFVWRGLPLPLAPNPRPLPDVLSSPPRSHTRGAELQQAPCRPSAPPSSARRSRRLWWRRSSPAAMRRGRSRAWPRRRRGGNCGEETWGGGRGRRAAYVFVLPRLPLAPLTRRSRGKHGSCAVDSPHRKSCR